MLYKGTDTAIAEGRRVVKHYRSVPALQGIHFFIQPGECVGFLGPNGAGKTTLLNIMCSLARLTSGELHLFGLDITRCAKEIKRRLGVLPQEENLDPDLTVKRNLEVYARYYGIPKKTAQLRAEELLHFIQLYDKRREKISKLSGGMKRRLLVARALVNNPELLILDEPTVGLDPHARHTIWQRLRTLQASGKTMILTTHYMDEAAYLCDRLYIIDQGKILAAGSPQDLIDRYVGREVLEVRIEKGDKERVLRRLEGLDFAVEGENGILYFFSDDCEAILKRLLPLGVPDLRRRSATLEDLFFKLTGREL